MSDPTREELAAAFHRAWWEAWGEKPNNWEDVRNPLHRERWLHLADIALARGEGEPPPDESGR